MALPGFAKAWLEHISSDLQPLDMLPFLVSNYVNQVCEILRRISEALRHERDSAKVDGNDMLDLVARAYELNNTDFIRNQPAGRGLGLQFYTTYRMAVIKLHHFLVILFNLLDKNVTQESPITGVISELRAQRVLSLRKLRQTGEEILNAARRLLRYTSNVPDISNTTGPVYHERQCDFPICWADAHRLIPAISVVAALPSMEPEQRHEAGVILNTIGLRFRIRQALVGNYHIPS